MKQKFKFDSSVSSHGLRDSSTKRASFRQIVKWNGHSLHQLAVDYRYKSEHSHTRMKLNVLSDRITMKSQWNRTTVSKSKSSDDFSYENNSYM